MIIWPICLCDFLVFDSLANKFHFIWWYTFRKVINVSNFLYSIFHKIHHVIYFQSAKQNSKIFFLHLDQCEIIPCMNICTFLDVPCFPIALWVTVSTIQSPRKEDRNYNISWVNILCINCPNIKYFKIKSISFWLIWCLQYLGHKKEMKRR